MKADILKKSEGRNPRPERNPNSEARTACPRIQILNLRSQISSESVGIHIANPRLFRAERNYQTNPLSTTKTQRAQRSAAFTKRTHRLARGSKVQVSSSKFSEITKRTQLETGRVFLPNEPMRSARQFKVS